MTDAAIEQLKGTEFEGYTHVHLMPYRVDNAILEVAKGNNSKTLPNVDKSSGNIHPQWNAEATLLWLKEPKIKQVVLVKNNDSYYGPLLEKVPERESVEKEDYIELKVKKKVDGKFQPYNSRIPSKCFYPLLDNDKDMNETIEEMVSNLLGNIGKEKGEHETDGKE